MNKIFKFVFPILMVVLGIVAIVGGVQKLQSKDLFDASASAVISGIDREWTGVDQDGFDEYDYKVYVNYEVDGKKYENVLFPGYSSSMKVGDELEIIYQTTDPGVIAEKNLTGNSIIFIIVGAVISLGGVIVGIRNFVKR